VNYNGRDLLGPLFEGLREQTYTDHEVVLVDNASVDDSVAWVQEHFPEVRVIASPENLGFSGGNNLGIRESRGEYFALLNNDTVPDRHCLAELVSELEADPSIGAVGAKLLFFRSYLPIELSTTPFDPASLPGGGADVRKLGVRWDEKSGFAGCDYRKPIFTHGFYTAEQADGRVLRWSEPNATVWLPIEHADRSAELRILTSGGPAAGRTLEVRLGGHELGTIDLSGTFQETRFTLSREIVEAEAFDVVNNAGTNLDDNGRAGDRGIYERDRGQYDAVVDIDAFCGAAALLRKEALDRVGLFDDDFFMYFEDTDLSWRIRRGGYRIRYRPSAVVRHLHATSSVEYSPLFNFYTARNQVLMIAKNAGLIPIARAVSTEFGIGLRLLRNWLRNRSDPHARQALRTRVQAERSLLKLLPKALWSRTH